MIVPIDFSFKQPLTVKKIKWKIDRELMSKDFTSHGPLFRLFK